MPKMDDLSRRERQIMDVIYTTGKATAAEVHRALPDAPTYSTVRALLRILEEKGHLQHRYQGPRYVFRPTMSRSKAQRSALGRVISTFFGGSAADMLPEVIDTSFGGSPTDMVSALINDGHFSQAQLDDLKARIEQARQEGR